MAYAFETPAGEIVIQPAESPTDDPTQVGPVDVVLLGVKAWQVEEAAECAAYGRPYNVRGPGVIAHDALAQLARINAPTQITFGRHDLVTSTRFADAMKNGIKRSELLVFESCSHAPIYKSVSEFNQKTLSFLSRHTG